MALVKICGIKTEKEAMASIDAGAQVLGFNFIKSSERYILPTLTKKIIKKLPKDIMTVGVFQNEKKQVIDNVITYLNLSFIQLHGEEDEAFCRNITKSKVIKAVKLIPEFDTEKTLIMMNKYPVDFFLLDRKIQGKGKVLNFEKVRKISNKLRLFLAGGLTPENVALAVEIAKPFGVDAASGVEVSGTKDKDKLFNFIKSVNLADY